MNTGLISILFKLLNEFVERTRPLKNIHFCSSSRKVEILTKGIHGVFRGLKFEPDAEIGQKGRFCNGLRKMYADYRNTRP
jgi:hypothetical protein